MTKRNPVAKHSPTAGAGRHRINTKYTRKPKHKGKHHE